MALELIRKPRGFYDKEKFCEKRMCFFIENRQKEMSISQSELGTLIGITQQAFGNRVNLRKGTCNLSAMQLVKILERLNASDDERAALLKMD